MQIILILLLLAGCSYNSSDINITLGKFHDIKLDSKGFNQKINSFQFLLQNAIEDMLYDLNHEGFTCKEQKNLILDISFKSHDLYSNMKTRANLEKQIVSYSIYYTLHYYDKKYHGQIKSIDTFIIPSYDYSYIISQEDSQIAGINNLIKQLEHELLHILDNICKEIKGKN